MEVGFLVGPTRNEIDLAHNACDILLNLLKDTLFEFSLLHNHGIKVNGQCRGHKTKFELDSKDWKWFGECQDDHSALERVWKKINTTASRSSPSFLNHTPSMRRKLNMTENSTIQRLSEDIIVDVDEEESLETVDVRKWNRASSAKMKDTICKLQETISVLRAESQKDELAIHELNEELNGYVEEIESMKVWRHVYCFSL